MKVNSVAVLCNGKKKRPLWKKKKLRSSLFLAGLLHILLIKGSAQGGDYFIVA